jgi:hypothetical protein
MAMSARRILFVLSALLIAGSVSACKNNTTLPTPEFKTETFSGTLGPNEKKSHTFTVNYAYAATAATVTVTSLVNSATSTPLSTTIGIGFGNIAFDKSCTLGNDASTNTATIGQTNGPVPVSAGPYCVQIFDAGTLNTLGVTANYEIKVEHY